MNCKPGDLAIIVRSLSENHGKIVKCLKLVPAGFDNTKEESGVRWIIDRNLPTTSGQHRNSAPDSFLLPIRPDDLHETEGDLIEPKSNHD